MGIWPSIKGVEVSRRQFRILISNYYLQASILETDSPNPFGTTYQIRNDILSNMAQTVLVVGGAGAQGVPIVEGNVTSEQISTHC